MKKKLIAILACRNNGSRLYAKPLQKLNNEINILDYILALISKTPVISETILAISDNVENLIYKDIAKKKGLKYYFGSDLDVLGRLVMGIKKTKATDVFRVTTESPFIHYEHIKKVWKMHIENNYDLSIFSNNVDGMGFEIFKSDALIKSHKYGKKKHKSELCDLYIRENLDDFRVKYFTTNIIKKNYRLTVDNPEDLVLCKKVFNNLFKKKEIIPSRKIINFLKKNKKEVNLTRKYISKSKSINNLWKNVKTI
tara:strand:+ start:184 stop:945 length:762 start_codon:yes stop_codon:yes gene_type:complete